VSIDEHHVALPKLYGAPAYARPPSYASTADRPFDPDDLPIEAYQDDDDKAFAATLPARAWAPGGVTVEATDTGVAEQPRLKGRQLSLRSIAGRLLHED
jgi:hypothetical protein